MLLKPIAFTRIAEAECEYLETERPVFKMFRLVSNNVQKPSQCIYSSWLLTSNKHIMFYSSLTKCTLSLLPVQLDSKNLSPPTENKIEKSCHLMFMALEQTSISMSNILKELIFLQSQHHSFCLHFPHFFPANVVNYFRLYYKMQRTYLLYCSYQ